MKPTELIRVLNTAGRGTVLTETRLRRHRNRAGYAISSDARAVKRTRYLAHGKVAMTALLPRAIRASVPPGNSKALVKSSLGRQILVIVQICKGVNVPVD